MKKKKTDEVKRPEKRGTRVAHDLRYSGREGRTITHRYSYRVKRKVWFSMRQWRFYMHAQSVTVLARAIEEKAAIALDDPTKTSDLVTWNTRTMPRAMIRVKIVRSAQSDAQPWYTVGRGKFRKLVCRLMVAIRLYARDASRFTVVFFPLRFCRLSRNPFSCTRRGS